MIPINIAKETIIGAIAATQITVHPTLDEYAGSEKPVLVQRQRTQRCRTGSHFTAAVKPASKR